MNDFIIVGDIGIWYMLKTLLLTLIFVGFIGYERQKKHKIAGMKTHMLVASGAAAIGILQELIYQQSLEQMAQYIEVNPEIAAALIQDHTRIVAAVVTGVGFLGTGAIIKTNGYITGLTTASTLWISAIVGLIFGMGFYSLGITVSIFALIALLLIRKLFNKEPNTYK